MTSFNFMNKTGTLADLLAVCQASLPHLPQTEKDEMERLLRRFETCGAPTLFGVGDVEAEEKIGLTDGEKEEVISRFIASYEIKSADFDMISQLEQEVLDERAPHIRVEYDTRYTGGEYTGTGETALIPLSLIQVFAQQDGDDGVALAFTKTTHHNSMHIVSYSLDEVVNAFGDSIEN